MSGPRLSIIPARAATDRALKPRDLQVLCVLGRHTDELGWCRKSQVKMADEMGCARSTVFEAVERLVKAGYLERHQQIEDNGRDSPHVYRVILDPRHPDPGSIREVDPEPDSEAADPCRYVGTPAGISAPPAGPEPAPPAGLGPAPKNDPLRTTHQNESERERERGNERNRTREVERWLKRHHPRWPSFVADSDPRTRAAALALTEEELAAAADRLDDYVASVGAIGRQKICAFSVYLGEKRWEKLPERPQQPISDYAPPFGPVWSAWLLARLVATGAEAEVAATSFRNIGRALSKGTAATKQQRQAFKALGLDAVEVSKRLQQDAVGTLRDVILKIRALPEHMQASVMSQLFGDEARALAPLINQVDILDQALANVADSATYLGSSQKEFEARSATTANAMQLFGNKMEALGIAIGSALLPAINDLMDALGPVVLAMAQFAETNPRLTRGIVGLVAGLVALRLAALAAQFAFLWLKGGVLTAALGIVQSAGLIGRAGLAIRAALTGWGSIAAGLGFTSAFSMFGSILAALPGMALSAVTGVVGAFAGMTAPIWGTIAAVIAAVASLALAVYNYWEPISNFVSGFASAIGAALSALVSEMIAFGSRIAGAIGSWSSQKVFDLAAWLGIDQEKVQKAVALVVGVMQDIKSTIVSAVKAIPAEIGNWFSDIFTMNDYSDAAEAEFRSMGQRAAQGLIDAIAAVPGQIGTLIGSIDFAAMGAALQQRLTEAVAAARAKLDELVTFLSGLPERIRAIFASIDLAAAGRALMNSLLEGIKAGAQAVLDYVSNIGSRIRSSIAGAASSAWSGVKSSLGMGGGETVEKRAAGGPVDALRPYLVGERGPELFMPAVHGTIMNAQKTASMLNGLRSNIVVPEPPRPMAATRAGRTASAGPASISFGNIIIQGGSGASAEQLRREFGREASAIMRSHFSDGGT